MHTTTTTTTTTTTIAPAGHTTTAVDDIVQAASAWASDQLLLSQGRCVDVLLDLYLATDDVGLRWSIADRLDEIRFLNAVVCIRVPRRPRGDRRHRDVVSACRTGVDRRHDERMPCDVGRVGARAIVPKSRRRSSPPSS